MTVYVVEIIPVKFSKGSYILGVYSDIDIARKAARIEVNNENASWWVDYLISQYDVNTQGKTKEWTKNQLESEYNCG